MSEQRLAAPRLRRGRRKLTLILVACLGVAGLLVGGAAWWLDREGPRLVTDRAEAISLVIPEGWTDETRRDARQIVPGDSGDGWARVPDIVAMTQATDMDEYEPVKVLHVYVDVAPDGLSLEDLHKVSQGMSNGFGESAVASVSPVREWKSLASTNSEYLASEVVTILSDTLVVTVYASAKDESGLREANQVITTLKIKDQ